MSLSTIPSGALAVDEDIDVSNDSISLEQDNTIDNCLPKDNEILGVDLSGDISIDGVKQEDDLDGGDIDINELSDNESLDSLEETLPGEFIESDSLSDDLDGGDTQQDESPAVLDDDGSIETLPEVSISEIFDIDAEDELDGAGSSTKVYKLNVSSSKVIKGSTIKVSWTFKNGSNHGRLYAILGSKAYPVDVKGNGSKNLKLPSSGKWRICMISYNKNNKCIYNGYKNSQGSLYVNVGTAPSGYGLSYSVQNKTKYVFKASLNNVSSYEAVILKDGVEYTRRNFRGNNEYFAIQPNKAGKYSVYLILHNDYGSYNGKSNNRILSFICRTPGVYKWAISSKSIKLGSKIKFTINDLNNADSAELIILKNANVVAKTKRFSGIRSIEYTPNVSGTYYAYMITYNDYGSYNGIVLSALIFKVDGTPQQYDLNIQGSYFSTSDYIRVSMNVKNADYYYMHIEKENSNGNGYGSEYVTYYSRKFTSNVNGNLKIAKGGKYRIYLNTYNAYGKLNGLLNGRVLYLTVTDNKNFQIGKDDYGFSNSFGSFNYRYYVDNNRNVISTDKIALQSYKDVFGNTSGYQKWKLDDTWGGSCFGFASTAALSYSNYLNKFGKDCLYDIRAPKNRINTITQRIERYQLSQNLKAVEKARNKTKNQFIDFLKEVTNYEKNGGIPIVVGVSSDTGGHAVIARSVFQDSYGRYIVNVSDNNFPGNKNMHIIINSSLNGFTYKSGNHTYNKNLKYCRADLMYNSMPNGVRLQSNLDGDVTENNTLRIYIDADIFTIKNSAGKDMLISDECIPASKYDATTDVNEYLLPKDLYTVEFKNYSNRQVKCSVSDDIDAIITSGTSANGTFYVGTENYSDHIRSTADFTDSETNESTVSAEYINSSAEIQKFEVSGKYLSASINSAGSLQINTDANTIKQNGIDVDLTTKEPEEGDEDLDGGTGTFSTFTFTNNMNDLDGFDGDTLHDYSLCITNNTLNRDLGILDGKIGIAVRNNTGEMIEASPYIAYYENGKLLKIEQQTIVLGANTSYFEVNVNKLEVLTNDEITIKVFLWNENMVPLSNPASLDI